MRYGIKNIVILLTAACLMTQCASTKVVTNKPTWLMTRPINQGYYIGIGYGNKKTNSNGYQQTAKNNAMNDMAGEIRVNVSGTSLLHTLEINNAVSETFDSKSLTSTDESLEGYELVDTYEDQYNYWTYYRLSKQTYEDIKQQRIRKATDNALTKYDKALTYKNGLQYYSALIMLVKGLEDIKPYMSETLLVNYQGKDVHLGNELFNEILNILNDINVSSDLKEIIVKKGQPVVEELLTFIVENKQGHHIENIPVTSDFTGCALIDNIDRSTASGIVSFSIPKVKSKNNHEYFYAKVDLNTILQEATNDFLIRKLLRNIKPVAYTKQVNVQNPVFFVSSTERKFEKSSENEVLKNALIGSLTQSALDITPKQNNADFLVDIQSNTKSAEISNSMYKVSLDAVITVKNKESKLLYQRNMNNITGIQLSFDAAGNEAYNSAVEYLKNRVVPDLLEKLF